MIEQFQKHWDGYKATTEQDTVDMEQIIFFAGALGMLRALSDYCQENERLPEHGELADCKEFLISSIKEQLENTCEDTE